MANFNTKVNLGTAIDSQSQVNASCDTLTTMSLFQPRVVYTKALVPGTTWSMSSENIVRLLPINAPTFMRMQLVTRAFFVPYRTVNRAWNNFITNTKNESSTLPTKAPWFSNKSIVNVMLFGTEEPGSFVTSNQYFSTIASSAPASYDLKIHTTNEGIVSTSYCILTKLGREVLALLNGLGYRIIWDNTADVKFNAYPWACLLKAHYDWFTTSQCNNAYNVTTLIEAHLKVFQNACLCGDTTTIATSSNNSQCILANSILAAMRNVHTSGLYEPSYFTSAFEQPQGPLLSGGLGSTFTINDTSSNNSSKVQTPSYGTPYIAASNAITKYGVQALGSLTDFMKRHQIAGGKALDRYLARFGYSLTSEKLNRCNYLGKGITSIQIGEVMSTSDTDNGTVGDYAGRGLGYGNDGKFNISTDEYGHIITIAKIVPINAGYVNGIQRECLKTDFMEFYQPEFDGLGNQAISAVELLADNNITMEDEFLDGNGVDKVYGYIPRYAEYKVGNDLLLGDYNYDTKNADLKPYIPFRLIGSQSSVADTYIQQYNSPTQAILYTYDDSDQYQRIFQATSDVDCFNVAYHFNVQLSLPMKPLFENYEFEHEGKQISMSVDGTMLNRPND